MTSAGAAHGAHPDALLLLDAGGNVIAADPAADRLFGPDPIRTSADLLERLDLDPDERLRFDGTHEHVEAERLGGGRALWVEVSVYPVPLEGPRWAASANPDKRLVVVARDVTARRRTRELREAFASVVSHELRTPVTTIYGGAQLLADASISDRTRGEASVAVGQEAERLYRLVEDLIVLARYDEPIEIGDEPVLLQRFLPGVAEAEEVRGDVRIRTRIPENLPPVIGRQGYVEQIVRHLLLGAVRFSSRGQTVSLDVRQVGECVELVVADSGPPIDEAEANEMFDLFHRSARTVSDASGANMSLFVCRRLTEAMGGRLWARPRARRGVEMGLSLAIAGGA